jgi:hypothetical protein
MATRVVTVKDLRKALENVPDDLRVVSSGGDHEYFPIYWVTRAKVGVIGNPENGDLYEWYGLDNANEDETEIEVFVVGD